jgi:hypothetical protein
MESIANFVEQPLCWHPFTDRSVQYELVSDAHGIPLAQLDMRTWPTSAYGYIADGSFIIKRTGELSSRAVIFATSVEEPLAFYDHRDQVLHFADDSVFVWSGAHMFSSALSWRTVSEQSLIQYELMPVSHEVTMTITESATSRPALSVLPLLAVLGCYIIACDRRENAGTYK